MYLLDKRAIPTQSNLVPLSDPLVSSNEQSLIKRVFCSYVYFPSGFSGV